MNGLFPSVSPKLNCDSNSIIKLGCGPGCFEWTLVDSSSHLYKEGVNTPLIRYHAIIAKIASIYEMAQAEDNIMDSHVDRMEMAARMYMKASDDARKDGKVRAADKYAEKAELCEEALEGYG